VELTGTDVQGRGRQVLQRADGMPIEARMQLSSNADRRRKQALPWRERSNCTATRSAWRTADSASGRLPLRRDVVSF
jgi:hypothetical protein